jgi:hypothetical protein
MALPQRKEPDDVRREDDERRENDATGSWCESDDGDGMARRNDLAVRRRRSGWGWLWLIVLVLFIWWAVWGMGNSGGWWRGHHNRTIGPGTNNGLNTGLPNNYGGMNGSTTNGANKTPNNNGATNNGATNGNGTANPPANNNGAYAPNGEPNSNNNGNASPPQH